MYFLFFACEIKYDVATLNIADRQNAHSMTLEMRTVVELFKLVKREKKMNREKLFDTRLAFVVIYMTFVNSSVELKEIFASDTKMSIQFTVVDVMLIISFDDLSFSNEMYKSLFISLFKLFRLKQISEFVDIIDYIYNNNSIVILVADSDIRKLMNFIVLEKVKKYFFDDEIVIFVCMFSSFIRSSNFNKFFRTQFELF